RRDDGWSRFHRAGGGDFRTMGSAARRAGLFVVRCRGVIADPVAGVTGDSVAVRRDDPLRAHYCCACGRRRKGGGAGGPGKGRRSVGSLTDANVGRSTSEHQELKKRRWPRKEPGWPRITQKPRLTAF